MVSILLAVLMTSTLVPPTIATLFKLEFVVAPCSSIFVVLAGTCRLYVVPVTLPPLIVIVPPLTLLELDSVIPP